MASTSSAWPTSSTTKRSKCSPGRGIDSSSDRGIAWEIQLLERGHEIGLARCEWKRAAISARWTRRSAP